MSDSLEFQDLLHAMDHAVRTAGMEQEGWTEEDLRLAALITITLDGDRDALLFTSRYTFREPGGGRGRGGGFMALCPLFGDAFTSWGELLGQELGGTITREAMERVIKNIRHWTRRSVDNIRTMLPSGAPLDELDIESEARED